MNELSDRQRAGMAFEYREALARRIWLAERQVDSSWAEAGPIARTVYRNLADKEARDCGYLE